MRLRVAALALASSSAVSALPPTGRPQRMAPGLHGISAPLWLQRPALVAPPPEDHEPRRIPLSAPAEPVRDPVVQSSVPALLAPPINLSFDGIGLGTMGVPSGQAFKVERDPPDPSGDVGPNHFVQIVNSSFAVFSKTGALLFGPVPTQTVFAGLGGACANGVGFDGIVLYDPLADRSGTTHVGVKANASLGTTLARIELYVDDQKIPGVSAQSSPAELVWNTESVNDGPYFLFARATDAEGNQGQSTGVAIWIQNNGDCGCSSNAGGWEAVALFGLLAAIRRRKQ